MENRPEQQAEAPIEQAEATRDEENTALQQAGRREAAEREETPDADQVFDSGNQGGMGAQGSGHGRRSGQHS